MLPGGKDPLVREIVVPVHASQTPVDVDDSSSFSTVAGSSRDLE
jgi:hypothetical protein